MGEEIAMKRNSHGQVLEDWEARNGQSYSTLQCSATYEVSIGFPKRN